MGNYHYPVALTSRKDKSQDCGGVAVSKCEWVFLENRKTAEGWLSLIHTTTDAKTQYSGDIHPAVCVRV